MVRIMITAPTEAKYLAMPLVNLAPPRGFDIPPLRLIQKLDAVPGVGRCLAECLEVFQRRPLRLLAGVARGKPVPRALIEGAGDEQQERGPYDGGDGRHERIEGKLTAADDPALSGMAIRLGQEIDESQHGCHGHRRRDQLPRPPTVHQAPPPRRSAIRAAHVVVGRARSSRRSGAHLPSDRSLRDVEKLRR
jgi:hypothetical protein